MTSQARATDRPRWRTVVAVAGLVALTSLGVPSTHGALTGTVDNTQNTAATRSPTCLAAVEESDPWLAYPMDESRRGTTTDVSGNGRSGSYATTSILGPLQPWPGEFETPGGPCPRDRARAVTLDGSNSYVRSGVTATNPQHFSVQVWFRTQTARGGQLIGLDAGGLLVPQDRLVYLTNAGNLVFGVHPSARHTVVSPAAYRDGAWHQVVATLAPTGSPQAGMRLYVDGALVASNASVVTAATRDGVWQVGYGDLGGWASRPTSNHFAGSVAWASVFTDALTPAEVASMHRAGRLGP